MPFAVAKKRRGFRDEDISPTLLAGNVRLLPVVCIDEWPGQNGAGNMRMVFHRTIWTNDGLPAHLHEFRASGNFIRQYCLAAFAGNGNQME